MDAGIDIGFARDLATVGWVGGEYGFGVGIVGVVHVFLFVVLMGSVTSVAGLSATCGFD